jgi:mRNA interferase YafQ
MSEHKSRQVEWAGSFKKQVKKLQKSGYDMSLLKTRMNQLIYNEPLPASAKEHWLTGNWKERRECRVRDKIKDDWLLIYSIWDANGHPVSFDDDGSDIENQTIIFEATGTHAELFR